MTAIDTILLIVLPYLALFVFIGGTIYRHQTNPFSVSSYSSEFLEGRKLFWGTIPFHWGLLFLFFGHLIAFLFPDGVLAWNSHPWRLLILEISAFAFGICVLFGLINLIRRRLTQPRIRVVTSNMDIVIYVVLLAQVILGLWTAYGYRWGSSWFAAVLTPYLWSIFKFSPDISAVSAMPWVIKLHIVGAYLLILLFPFSRLMHVLVVPIKYLWRPYQKVVWYWDRKWVRQPGKGYFEKPKAKNN